MVEGVVYGPLASRRFGLSLGLNLLPPGRKTCSFECPYCQCGRAARSARPGRWPTPAQVEMETREALRKLRAKGVVPDRLTLSGNGEPTMHPKFAECVRAILRARDAEMPSVRVICLTNGAHLDRSGVVEGLNLLDERHVKIDAGTEQVFQAVNAPRSRATLPAVLRNVGRLRDFTAQAMFVRGCIDNSTPAAVRAWIRALRVVRPRAVHLYTIDRRPADPELRPVSRRRLEAIAAMVTGRTGIPAQVHVAVPSQSDRNRKNLSRASWKERGLPDERTVQARTRQRRSGTRQESV